MTVLSGQQYHQNLVHYLRADVVFGDDDSVVPLGWVPGNATIIGGGVVVTEAFNAGTTNVLDIGFRNAGDGTTDDDDEFATNLELGTLGVIEADELATSGAAHFSAGAEITATVQLTGTAATAGAGIAYVTYIVKNEG